MAGTAAVADAAITGWLGRCPVWAQFISSLAEVSSCPGSGCPDPDEDAQAAESTSDERVRTRTPSFFFMGNSSRNSNAGYSAFGEEYTAETAWIAPARGF